MVLIFSLLNVFVSVINRKVSTVHSRNSDFCHFEKSPRLLVEDVCPVLIYLGTSSFWFNFMILEHFKFFLEMFVCFESFWIFLGYKVLFFCNIQNFWNLNFRKSWVFWARSISEPEAFLGWVHFMAQCVSQLGVVQQDLTEVLLGGVQLAGEF